MVFRLSSVSKVNDANLSGKRFKAIRPEKEGILTRCIGFNYVGYQSRDERRSIPRL